LDDIVAAFAQQNAELAGLLAGADDDGWRRPSRCEGWTVADVVLHVAQTNEMAVASVEDRFGEYLESVARSLSGPSADVDEGADLMVAAERDQPPEAIGDRWQTAADRFLSLVDDADLHRRVSWVAGELSMRTLVTTRLAETWIHTGDVADGLGVELKPADRLRYVARLAWRTLPYAFARAGQSLSGPVAFSLKGPDGAPWEFKPDSPAVTTITGDGVELCLVAARRSSPDDTGLSGEGPDADAVLGLVRTYA
jgi:uncharacterized protein (TIGR03084 family)